MLILFSVSNYRSFLEEQELSLVASSYYGKTGKSGVTPARERQIMERRLPGLSGKSFLRCAAIYGANGSGKSNLTHALATMRGMVLHSGSLLPEDRLPYRPFALAESAKGRPASFFVAFEWEGTRYEYGFSYLADRIVSEDLYSFPKGLARLIFSREVSEEGSSHIKLGSRVKIDEAVLSLVNSNVLLLSFLYSHPGAQGHETIRPVGRFFEKGLIVLDRVEDRWANFPHTGEVVDGTAGTDFQRATIRKMVRDSDIGVRDVHVVTRKLTPEEIRRYQGLPGGSNADAEAPQVVKQVVFDHESSTGKSGIALSDESLGTNQMFSLSSYVAAALEDGSTLVVDELDASLHPLLCREIVGMFERDEKATSTAQLVFTTHQTSLMDGDLLERDQIWLSEKQDDGSTLLEPLSDYSLRKNEKLEQGYLSGRYEGVPVLPFDYGRTHGEAKDA